MGDSKYDFEHSFRNNIRQAISNGEEADSYSSDEHDGEGAAVKGIAISSMDLVFLKKAIMAL